MRDTGAANESANPVPVQVPSIVPTMSMMDEGVCERRPSLMDSSDTEDDGRSTSTRAVARACATNPVALVIPCHRVVPKNGSLGGYRWGVSRKQALLNLESQLSCISSSSDD